MITSQYQPIIVPSNYLNKSTTTSNNKPHVLKQASSSYSNSTINTTDPNSQFNSSISANSGSHYKSRSAAFIDREQIGSINMLNTEWAEIEIVELLNERQCTESGLNIIGGGATLGFSLMGSKSTGVVIRSIFSGSAADKNGRLRIGDHLMYIDDINVRGMTSEQIASILRQCGDHVRLIVARPIANYSGPIDESMNNSYTIIPTEQIDQHLDFLVNTLLPVSDFKAMELYQQLSQSDDLSNKLLDPNALDEQTKHILQYVHTQYKQESEMSTTNINNEDSVLQQITSDITDKKDEISFQNNSTDSIRKDENNEDEIPYEKKSAKSKNKSISVIRSISEGREIVPASFSISHINSSSNSITNIKSKSLDLEPSNSNPCSYSNLSETIPLNSKQMISKQSMNPTKKKSKKINSTKNSSNSKIGDCEDRNSRNYPNHHPTRLANSVTSISSPNSISILLTESRKQQRQKSLQIQPHTRSSTNSTRSKRKASSTRSSSSRSSKIRINEENIFEEYDTELTKDDNGLGLTIAGYITCRPEVNIHGIFVKSITKNSAAELNGNIRINDQIIEINQKSVIGYDNPSVVNLLKQTTGTVKLKFHRFTKGPIHEILTQTAKTSASITAPSSIASSNQQLIVKHTHHKSSNSSLNSNNAQPITIEDDMIRRSPHQSNPHHHFHQQKYNNHHSSHQPHHHQHHSQNHPHITSSIFPPPPPSQPHQHTNQYMNQCNINVHPDSAHLHISPSNSSGYSNNNNNNSNNNSNNNNDKTSSSPNSSRSGNLSDEASSDLCSNSSSNNRCKYRQQRHNKVSSSKHYYPNDDDRDYFGYDKKPDVQDRKILFVGEGPSKSNTGTKAEELMANIFPNTGGFNMEKMNLRHASIDKTIEDTIKLTWNKIIGTSYHIIIAYVGNPAEGLGISLEGTVDVDDVTGLEDKPRHYLKTINPSGPVGQCGMFKSGDELLEVNGKKLYGVKYQEVLAALKALPNRVQIVCARRKAVDLDALSRSSSTMIYDEYIQSLYGDEDDDDSDDEADDDDNDNMSLDIDYHSINQIEELCKGSVLWKQGTDMATIMMKMLNSGVTKVDAATVKGQTGEVYDEIIRNPMLSKAKSDDNLHKATASSLLDLVMDKSYTFNRSLQYLRDVAMWSGPILVELDKESHGLGFSIEYYQDPIYHIPVIVISTLVPNGTAHLDGRIIPGDRLLFINEVEVDSLVCREEVIEVLRSLPLGKVLLGIAKPIFPSGNMYRSYSKDSVDEKSSTTEQQEAPEPRIEPIEDEVREISPIKIPEKRIEHDDSDIDRLFAATLGDTASRGRPISSIMSEDYHVQQRQQIIISDEEEDNDMEEDESESNIPSSDINSSSSIDCLDELEVTKVSESDTDTLFQYWKKNNVPEPKESKESHLDSLKKWCLIDLGVTDISLDTTRWCGVGYPALHRRNHNQIPTIDPYKPGDIITDLNDQSLAEYNPATIHLLLNELHRSRELIRVGYIPSDEFETRNWLDSNPQMVPAQLLTSGHNVIPTPITDSIINQPNQRIYKCSYDNENNEATPDLSRYCTTSMNSESVPLQLEKEMDTNFEVFPTNNYESMINSSMLKSEPFDPVIIPTPTTAPTTEEEDNMEPISMETNLQNVTRLQREFINIPGWSLPRKVTVIRQPNQSLGISILGGKVANVIDKGDQGDETSLISGIFITQVTTDSPADRSGQLNIGDRLLSVNGNDLIKASYEDAISFIKNATSPIIFTVQSLLDASLLTDVSQECNNDNSNITNNQSSHTTPTTVDDLSYYSLGKEQSPPPTFPTISAVVDDHEQEPLSINEPIQSSYSFEQPFSTISQYKEPNITSTTPEKPQRHFPSSAYSQDPHSVQAQPINNNNLVPDEKDNNSFSVSSLSNESVTPDISEFGSSQQKSSTNATNIPAPNQIETMETLEITIDKKGNKGLGLLLVGNKNCQSMNCYICGFKDNSVAVEDGRLQIGDELLKINNVDVHGMSHSNVAPIIKKCQNESEKIVLKIRRRLSNVDKMACIPGSVVCSSNLGSPSETTLTDLNKRNLSSGQDLSIYGDIYYINLEKSSQGFGFFIMDGNINDEVGIYVKKITNEGIAAKEGTLKEGDRILMINNMLVVHEDYDSVLKRLRGCQNQLHMVVGRITSPASVTLSDNMAATNIASSIIESSHIEPVKQEEIDMTDHPQPISAKAVASPVLQMATNDENRRQSSATARKSITGSQQTPISTVQQLSKDSSTSEKEPIYSSIAPETKRNSVQKSVSIQQTPIIEDTNKPQASSAVKKVSVCDDKPEKKSVTTTDSTTKSSTSKSSSSRLAQKEHPTKAKIVAGVETVIEISKDRGLGLSIVGGSDTILGTVMIHEVHENEAAALDGRLWAGDRVLAVNGKDLRNATHEQAIQALRSVGTRVRLKIFRDPKPLCEDTLYFKMKVELVKKSKKGLGICIVSKSDVGVCVSDLVKGCIAEQDGTLKKGDLLLEINDVNVRSYSQEQVATLLKMCNGNVSLMVGRLRSSICSSDTKDVKGKKKKKK